MLEVYTPNILNDKTVSIAPDGLQPPPSERCPWGLLTQGLVDNVQLKASPAPHSLNRESVSGYIYRPSQLY